MSFESDVAKFQASLKKVIKDAEKGGFLTNVAARAIDLIRNRTRDGKGVAKPGGSEFKLKPLSKVYVEYRKANASRLSAFTSAGKSNLTFTGQMLNGMTLKKGARKLTITFDTAKNRRKAQYVSAVRPFLNLSKKEGQEVEKFFRKNFDSLVSRSVK